MASHFPSNVAGVPQLVVRALNDPGPSKRSSRDSSHSPIALHTRAPYRTPNNPSCFPAKGHPTSLCLEPSSSTSCTLCLSNTQVSFTYHMLKKAFHVTPTPDQIPRFIPSPHTMSFSFIGTYQFVIVHLFVISL